MDEEHPRTETSINNRSDLRAILHIEDLYRKNKVRVIAGDSWGCENNVFTDFCNCRLTTSL